MLWGGSRSTKLCVFPCKVAAAGDDRYLMCAAVAAAVGLPFFFCRSVMGSVLRRSRSTKPCVFPCKVAAAGDERYLMCAAVAATVGLPFFLPQCNGLCFEEEPEHETLCFSV